MGQNYLVLKFKIITQKALFIQSLLLTLFFKIGIIKLIDMINSSYRIKE